MNDIINKLPKMIMGEDINTELSVLPTYNDNIRKEDTTIRLMALSDLYNIYIPSSMSTEIYCKLYLALIHSLKKKSGITAIHQRNENYALSEGIGRDKKLFNISSRGVSKHLKRVCEYLGYERVGTHSFRKFFATSIYNNNGYNVELVRELLQHSSVAITQAYLGVSPQIVEKALLNHIYIPNLNQPEKAKVI